MRACLLLAAVLLACVGLEPAWAGEARAGMSRGPHYAGTPISIYVEATGFEKTPEPTCKPPATPKGVTLRYVGVRPQETSFIQIFNGKRVEEHRVTYRYEFEAIVETPRSVALGPFVVVQDQARAATKPVTFAVRAVSNDPNMHIELKVPEGPHAPGERIPVELSWTFANDGEDPQGVVIRSEFFDAFSFDDEPAPRTGARIPITTPTGVIPMAVDVERTKINGKRALRVRGKRIWRVDRAGTHHFAPITVEMQRVTRWRRTFFGREPAATERVRAQGKPLTVVVEALPEAGRPASFAGAVGRGFSIDVTADRTVVRAGDPIRLKITLRGDGNLQDAGLPPLTAGGGLDPRDFRQADAEATGEVTDDGKVFEVTVRVEHDRVANVPPIEYAWWNPQARKYETARSKPIALQVGEADIVSADDVVRAGGTDTTPARDPATDATTTPARMATGADLALVEDGARLRARPGGWTLPGLLYLAGALALLGAWFVRRRAQEDPAIRARAKAGAEAARAITKARGLSATEGAAHVASVLRAHRAAHADLPLPDGWDDTIARLDAISYQRGAGDKSLPADLLTDAQRLAGELTK